MTEPQSTNSGDILTVPPPPGIFSTKIPSSVTFAVGILLFVMPFVEVKCNNMSLQKISGMELATGFRIKTSADPFLEKFNTMDNSDNTTIKKTERKDPNIYALCAILLGGLGFVFSMFSPKAGGVGGLLCGGLSAVSLIILWTDVKKEIKAEIAVSGAVGEGMRISADFTPVFYITVIVFIAAAVMSYKRMQMR